MGRVLYASATCNFLICHYIFLSPVGNENGMTYHVVTFLSYFLTILATKRDKKSCSIMFTLGPKYPPPPPINTDTYCFGQKILTQQKLIIYTAIVKLFMDHWEVSALPAGCAFGNVYIFCKRKHRKCTWMWTSPGGGVTCCVVYVWHVVHRGMHAICVYPPCVQHLINRSLETCAHHVRLIIKAARCGLLRACADCPNPQQQSRNCSKILFVVIHKTELQSRNCNKILSIVIHKAEQQSRNCS